RCAR
ncbi:pepSY-associated TM helix family protein, partial [Vibrio parahaemolyticus VP2007-007]